MIGSHSWYEVPIYPSKVNIERRLLIAKDVDNRRGALLGTRQGTAGRFCYRIGFRLAVATQMEQPMNTCIRSALRYARRTCLMSLVGSQVPLARQHSRRTRMTRRGLSPLSLAGVIGDMYETFRLSKDVSTFNDHTEDNPVKTFARHSAFWALLSLLLAPLAVGHASSTNIVVVTDRFGREVNGTGITLVDWEGYIANPAMKYTVKAPSGATETRVTLSSSEPRLHFNQPSWSGIEGSRKELDFSGTLSQAEFYISIFPDRDGLDEVHSLTIEYLDLNENRHTQTVDVHVVDQDVSSRALDFDITLDFSQDQTVLFNDSVVRETVQQAADDWAHFIDDMDLDQVASGQEESWIWDVRGYSHGSKPIRNKIDYTGFLLYAYGIRVVVSGGQPSLGSYQSVNGVSLPLRRSGNISINTQGNYNTLGWMTSLPDEEWWKATNFGDVQNDLYSIVLHEIGHALVFNPGYDEFDKFKKLGYVKDPAVKKYYDSYPVIDRFDHLPETIDPVSKRGAFGREYGGEISLLGDQMPLGRWLITKGHLLVAQAIGYTLRETSPFTPLSIAAVPSEGTLDAPYSYTANVSGGTPAYYWSIESGTLPEGLSIDSFTGTISGTPRQHGTFNFTISVSDYDETTPSITRTLTLTIREGETESLADSEPSSEDQQGAEEQHSAVEPQARLTPDPSEVAFSADDSAWKTFTVHTNLDSVLVRANPSGSDPAIEVSGGQQVPTRDYCPAEGNDRPTSGRRDGWNLHVKACRAGRTKILLIDYDTGEVLQQYEINVIDNDSAVEPQAWLTPDPSEVAFSADDPAWKTFTVHTNLDSVLVRANPSGSDPAIEVSGGQQAPTRDYCPAEGNDRPTSGRRDGWNLHVKACQAGQTKILLIDYDTGEVLQQYEVNVEASTSASAATVLNPSYPNPFNSETILSYTLPTASDIRLEVFTLSGQRVAVLHEGFQAAGYHTLSMDASDLASGVYLYRLTTPAGRFTQKFTLLR